MSRWAMLMADRISSLPDTLLSHILSFLPTKEAVASSVLSKRWRPLWLSVSTLRFHDESYLENKEKYFRFLQLVYTAMLLRDEAQPIQRFYLKCTSSLCDSSTVNTWVMTAIQRKVERIGLALPSTVNLPSCLLTSTTLVVLKLRLLNVNHVSSSVNFPSLKTLCLRKVHFCEPICLYKILSACPVLEDLLLRSLQFTNLLSDGQLKRLPKLVKASISNCCISIPVATFCNVEFLRTQVSMNTTNVEMYTFINLTYLELIFDRYYWNWLIQLLHHCLNLQILVIEKENPFNIASIEEDWIHPKLVPKCLSSKLKRFFVRKYEGRGGELQFARYIMQNAEVLCSLKISSRSFTNSEQKLQMIKKLSSCSRISATCKLFFE